jgi:hypothetical protein
MTTKKHDNCPECLAALVPGEGVCAVCGWDGMNQGDYHSGPAGYSPNTAYPNTQYGSGFDDDEAEWNH